MILLILSPLPAEDVGVGFIRPAGLMNQAPTPVKLGIEVLIEKNPDLLKGKRGGLITNRTGVDSQLRSSIDLIRSLPDVNLTALYAPEHGVRGGLRDFIHHSVDEKTGIPVFSLYGATRKPTGEMLKDVDVLVFDLQDIGSRSYTYISTLKLCMQESAKYRIPFIVLDRPNPVNGTLVDGPVLDPKFESFIGPGPIAYLHGMTIGEIAQYFNEEFQIHCDLEVIPMEGWQRRMTWRDTGLVWTPPSPNIPEADSAWFYPITGILGELSLVNEGVGYTLPFKVVGAPWIDAEEISGLLNRRNIPGVYFQPFNFTPLSHIHKDKFCGGFKIIITDENPLRPVVVGYHIMDVLLRKYPKQFNFSLPVSKKRLRTFDNANGTDTIRLRLEDGVPVEEIVKDYQPGLEEFLKKRERYLLYQ